MKVKWIVGLGFLIILIISAGLFLILRSYGNTGLGGYEAPAPAVASWLSCETDSDCIPNMDSSVCCSNRHSANNIVGPCNAEEYKGYCTCYIQAGLNEGYCNGLKSTEEELIR